MRFSYVDIFWELTVPYFSDRIEARVIFDVAKGFVHAFGDRSTFYAEAEILAFWERCLREGLSWS